MPIGLLLAAIWLLLYGVNQFIPYNEILHYVTVFAGLVAGLLLVVGARSANRGLWGLILFGLWLLLHHLVGLISLSFDYMNEILFVIQIVAGILLFVGGKTSWRRSVGNILLALFLIVPPVLMLLGINPPEMKYVVGALAALAGLFILIRR